MVFRSLPVLVKWMPPERVLVGNQSNERNDDGQAVK